MDRVHPRQVVAPEAELGHGQETRDKDPTFQNFKVVIGQITCRGEEKNQRYEKEPGNLKEPEQAAATDDVHGQESQGETSGEPPRFLPEIHRAHRLLLLIYQWPDFLHERLAFLTLRVDFV